MARIDPAELREYARRDWAAPERLARQDRANQSLARKIQLVVELYEAARALRPGWPDEETRRSDLQSHLRVRALLDDAAHVGAR